MLKEPEIVKLRNSLINTCRDFIQLLKSFHKNSFRGGLSKNKHKSKLKKETSWKEPKAMVQGMRAGGKLHENDLKLSHLKQKTPAQIGSQAGYLIWITVSQTGGHRVNAVY